MVKIFISYRRDDSADITDSIYLQLQQHYDEDSVFLDVGSIPFGVDFRQYLSEQIEAHDVVLVIIGKEWARIMRERADQQNDFVRIEIESALQQDKLVIPVLVRNASMPNFNDLPDSIRDLQWRNSATIRRLPDLIPDCQRLADGIRQWASHNNITSSDTDTTDNQPVKPQPTERPPSVMDTLTPLPKMPTIAKLTSHHLMPTPFEWVTIPAGTVETDKAIYEIEPFTIAKYPITNAQFAKFIEAGGYQQQAWWTAQGWQQCQQNSWTMPRFWHDEKFNGDAQPVVGVSWFEAIAFCLWLGDSTGEMITLPTEYAWQYSAQGHEVFDYPWGNHWNGNACNSNVDSSGIGQTTPVTQFMHTGKSPFGVVDMVGNVWEWCSTNFSNNTNDITSDARYRALRGGSWNNHETEYFRCEYRNRDEPHLAFDATGFRIARTD